MLAKAIGIVIAELRREWQREIVAKVGKLKHEVKALRQQIVSDTENGIEVYCTGLERPSRRPRSGKYQTQSNARHRARATEKLLEARTQWITSAAFLLYSPQYLAALRNTLAAAKADLHEMHFRHLCGLADLRKEIAELRSILADVVALRTQAETDVATLRRQLETALVKLAQRDPQKPLH